MGNLKQRRAVAIGFMHICFIYFVLIGEYTNKCTEWKWTSLDTDLDLPPTCNLESSQGFKNCSTSAQLLQLYQCFWSLLGMHVSGLDCVWVHIGIMMRCGSFHSIHRYWLLTVSFCNVCSVAVCLFHTCGVYPSIVSWGLQSYQKFWLCISFLTNCRRVNLLILENNTSSVQVCMHRQRPAHTETCIRLKCFNDWDCMNQYRLSKSNFQCAWTSHEMQQHLSGWSKKQINFVIKVWWFTEEGSAIVMKETMVKEVVNTNPAAPEHLRISEVFFFLTKSSKQK